MEIDSFIIQHSTYVTFFVATKKKKPTSIYVAHKQTSVLGVQGLKYENKQKKLIQFYRK